MTDALTIDVVTRPLVFAALAALAFAPLEHLLGARQDRRSVFAADVAADVAFATLGQILARLGVVLGVGWALARLDDIAIDRPPFAGIADARERAAVDVAVGLVLFELGGYLYHRLAHRVRWLWRLHEIHHSSERMDWLASFRQHPLEIVLMTLFQNAPLVLLGVPLGAHATVLALLKLNTIFVHANLRVPAGPWSHVLATPAFHHRHHQRDGATRNYASLFPFIDRIFGTYSSETPTGFGLPEPRPARFLALMAAPLRR